jgi:pilus assembly protein Flp/PilA
MSLIRRFLGDERGTTSIEYAVIVGLIFLVIVAAANALSGKVVEMFNRLSTAIAGAIG